MLGWQVGAASVLSPFFSPALLQASNGGSSQGTLTVTVIQVDHAPVFAASVFNYTVPEGSVAGAALSSSLPIASTNPNARNVPVYRLLSSNPPTSNFVIDPLSGQLSLWAGVSGGTLLFNAGATYPQPRTFALQISAQVGCQSAVMRLSSPHAR